MLFVDDIILFDESLNEINFKLELQRKSLETKGIILCSIRTEYRLHSTRTEYMRNNFKNTKNRLEDIINWMDKNFYYVKVLCFIRTSNQMDKMQRLMNMLIIE